MFKTILFGTYFNPLHRFVISIILGSVPLAYSFDHDGYYNWYIANTSLAVLGAILFVALFVPPFFFSKKNK